MLCGPRQFDFHPLVAQWFTEKFGGPTEPQELGWPEIQAGRNVLIAAPTGSGKTLAAFLVCIDRMLRQAIAGTLRDDATQVVYVSPLKALSNDIHRNLELPLAEIRERAVAAGHELPDIRVAVRTGDTPASQRQAMVRRPPHILVTTPESLYLILTSPKARQPLMGVKTVIVDEIHALARDKRGSHLALSLERLDAFCSSSPVLLGARPDSEEERTSNIEHRTSNVEGKEEVEEKEKVARPVRIGLSATQRPMEEIARFLVGARGDQPADEIDCRIIDTGHVRQLDLQIDVPPSELSAVCSGEQWAEVYSRLAELIQSHRSTLVFVNTRRLAERVCHHLGETLGEDAVASHHGSLSRERRLSAERRLQSGELKAIVATASLELGIDVGYIDLVCQISSPRSIATFLQRIGRSGHSLGKIPKGRLFPLTRDDLIESMALIRAVKERRLDKIEIPVKPLDILAQQIVAAVAADDWREDDLFHSFRAAWPYRDLWREEFNKVLELLSEGFARGARRVAYLHRDKINGMLRARRHARIAAVTSGGAIPDTADYRVVTEGEGTFVGTVNEDFAIESIAGDVFLLGNSSWRVRHVRAGEVVVSDAEGAPATIPFWLGEAPGRTIELSEEVSSLREWMAERIAQGSPFAPRVDEGTRGASHPHWEELEYQCGAPPWAAEQAVNYIASQVAAVGFVPTCGKILFERFFDESGGMQLVIHAPLGSRINRAWGLAIRKRFCRSFDFELQAAADDNGIVLSLGTQHSFAVADLFKMLSRANGEPLLVQALLAAPMFNVRWRWNITRALAVLRTKNGQRVPPHLLRMRSDDLLTAVFPAQTACLENVVGDIEVPDHPIVHQTVHDCLHEAMDIERWTSLLGEIEDGRVELVPLDTREPSPFSYQILNANPYAFLDDAPLEERRARAVAQRRSISPADVSDLARLDPEAVEQVRREAWPTVRDADELHDTLTWMTALPEDEGGEWRAQFDELAAAGRAARIRVPAPDAVRVFWFAAEKLPLLRALYPQGEVEPPLTLPPHLNADVEPEAAAVALVRGRVDVSGPITAAEIADLYALEPSRIEAALFALEGDGAVLRGNFAPHSSPDHRSPVPLQQWCERRLLARIHRLTLTAAREKVKPVEAEAFLRFLCEHQHVTAASRLKDRQGLREVIAQLQGFEISGGAWERDVLPCRLGDYDPAWLDDLSMSGDLAWGRLLPPKKPDDKPPSGSGVTRVVPLSLLRRADLAWLLPVDRSAPDAMARGDARLVYDTLVQHGALFFHDLLDATGLLPVQLEGALSELAALGAVTSDGFATIRTLVSPDIKRNSGSLHGRARKRRNVSRSYNRGRWSKFPATSPKAKGEERTERWAWQLLERYGVMFRDLLAREDVAPHWSELVRVYRRLEAQGKVFGGRFVSGVAGEQYALPGAVERLRRARDASAGSEPIIVSAADPLNLAGIVTRGERVPAVASNALAYLDGRHVASLVAGEVRWHAELPAELSVALARDIRRAAAMRLRSEPREQASIPFRRSSDSGEPLKAARPRQRKLI